MIKKIVKIADDERDYGFYDVGLLSEFLKVKFNAELVRKETLAPNQWSDDRESTAYTYHIEPQGVTTRAVTMTLGGREETITEIERIILDEVAKHR
ncbi:hypothetical protein HZC30_02225 [Candidatus Woesearchaeota archaeon]|nr:hypothetical protein [Candidatus Woesearchaeota archaeon]